MAKKIKVVDNKSENSSNVIIEKDKRGIISILIIFNVILVASLTWTVIYYKNILDEITIEKEDLESELIDVKYDNQKLKDDNSSKNLDLIMLTGDKSVSSVSEKLDFFDDNIVFQIEGFGKKYYTYDCMMKKVANKDNYTYWAYNIELAKYNGLKKGGC